MSDIMQGTTPSLVLEVDPEDLWVETATRIELYVQNGGQIATYTGEDLTIDAEANTITKHFSEAETAAFRREFLVMAQARFWMPNGEVVGSRKVSFDVADMLGVGD